MRHGKKTYSSLKRAFCFTILTTCLTFSSPGNAQPVVNESYATASNTVVSLYNEILNRPPDEAGFTFYTRQLLGGKDSTWLRDVLENSPEAQNLRDKTRLKHQLMLIRHAQVFKKIFFAAFIFILLWLCVRTDTPFLKNLHRIFSKKRSTNALAICAIISGLILTTARIHGFSFSMWHKIIDNSAPAEVFWSKPHDIRSDDWLVNIPHCISQRADNPPFARNNKLIGDGNYNMIVTGAAPVLDITTLFRPHIWGYFISSDTGMAFEWWFKAIGLWLAIYILLRKLTGNDNLTSFSGATVMLFSPFFQAWSLNSAPSVIFAAATLLSLKKLGTTRKTTASLTAALTLFWSGAAFLMTFYHGPYLITLLYLILFMLPDTGLFTANKNRIPWPHLIAVVMLIAGVVIYLLVANWDVINIIRAGAYPGQRISAGSDQAIWQLMRGNIISIFPPDNFGNSNACENAAFFITFPLVITAIVKDWRQTGQRPTIPMFCLTAYILFLLIWNLAGLPPAIARWTLLSRTPAQRTLIGLGLADLLLLTAYIKHHRPISSNTRIIPWIICLAWAALHLVLSVKAARHFPDYPVTAALTGALPIIALGPLFFIKPRLILPALMIISVTTTCAINPLARGGAGFVTENPLSEKIQDLALTEKQQGHDTVWIAYDDIALPVLCRMLGARALNGIHAYPQTELWSILDPESLNKPVYNRYAHLMFSLPDTADKREIRLIQTDLVRAELHPEDPRFGQLKINYIICHDKHTGILDKISNLEKIFSYGDKHIYRATAFPLPVSAGVTQNTE